MSKKRVLSILMSVVMSASLLAGSAVSALAEDGAKEPVVFKLASDRQNVSLDYMNQRGIFSALEWIIGDPLIHIDENGEFVPWVATEWTWDEDYMGITMKLRDDVYFQDGNKMTAEDVAYTYSRPIKDTSLLSAGSYSAYESVEAVDETTVRFNFNKLFPTFFTTIYQPMIEEKALSEPDFEAYWENPVGTGAFKITEWDRTSGSMTLQRNDDWWGWSLGEKSNVDVIEYTYVSEATTRLSGLRAGDFDFINPVTASDAELLEAEGFDLQRMDQQGKVEYISFNCSQDYWFSDQNLREAVSLAIDRQGIVDQIMGGGVASTWPVMNALGEREGADAYAYDPEKAKELVADSAYDGSEIKMLYNSSSFAKVGEVAEAIQSMLNSIGFNIILDPRESATVNEIRAAGEYDMCLDNIGWGGGDSYKNITELMYQDVMNTHYEDPEMNTLCETFMSKVDEAERQAAAEECYQYEVDHFGPCVSLYQDYGINAYKTGISGITLAMYNEARDMYLAYMQME